MVGLCSCSQCPGEKPHLEYGSALVQVWWLEKGKRGIELIWKAEATAQLQVGQWETVTECFLLGKNTTKLRRAVDKASCCLAGQCLFPSGGDKGIKGTGNSLNVRSPIFHRRDNIPMSKQIKKQFKRGKCSGLLQPTHRKPVLQALYNIQNRPTILRITFPSSIANIHDNKSVINSGTKWCIRQRHLS